MSIKVKKPEVKMNLYETDKDVLKSFITNEKIDGVFTEKYLILQNFARPRSSASSSVMGG